MMPVPAVIGCKCRHVERRLNKNIGMLSVDWVFKPETGLEIDIEPRRVIGIVFKLEYFFALGRKTMQNRPDIMMHKCRYGAAYYPVEGG